MARHLEFRRTRDAKALGSDALRILNADQSQYQDGRWWCSSVSLRSAGQLTVELFHREVCRRDRTVEAAFQCWTALCRTWRRRPGAGCRPAPTVSWRRRHVESASDRQRVRSGVGGLFVRATRGIVSEVCAESMSVSREIKGHSGLAVKCFL